MPIVIPVNVFEVVFMSTGEVKAISEALCHFTTLPVYPVKNKSANKVNAVLPDADNAGLKLPAGFGALKVADGLLK